MQNAQKYTFNKSDVLMQFYFVPLSSENYYIF